MHPRRLAAVLAGGLALFAVALAAVLLRGDGASAVDDSPILRVAAPAATTTTEETTTTVTTVAEAPTTTTAFAPVSPPKDAYAAEPIRQLGFLEIPKLGMRQPLFQGISLRNIDRGPSHWPGTALPGQRGNVVIAGHRVTHSRPFRHIDQLVEGDLVHFDIDGVRTTYAVTGHEIVPPTALWIVDQTPTPTATLFACHPPGSARQRYVVRLKLVE